MVCIFVNAAASGLVGSGNSITFLFISQPVIQTISPALVALKSLNSEVKNSSPFTRRFVELPCNVYGSISVL
ncbi:hypothetical protein DP49_5882 [Burkholderia pseudomallei]|nr:hypothetical protein DP49_5882 [Burkholderia pseudomallei]KGS72897.1 hypothetical protein X942_5961 [Burkholderia pseudomallei MSHR5596]